MRFKKEKKMEKLSQEEVRSFIKRIAPRLGYDFTYDLIFPEGREDICAISHMAENGTSYGFDTVYVVWKEPDGKLNYEEIANSRTTKDYIRVQSVEFDENGGNLIVKFGSGGSFSGKPWDRAVEINLEKK